MDCGWYGWGGSEQGVAGRMQGWTRRVVTGWDYVSKVGWVGTERVGGRDSV